MPEIRRRAARGKRRPELYDPDWLTVRAVAEKLSVSEHRVRIWLADGKLEATVVGPRLWRIHKASLDTFLAGWGKPSGPAVELDRWQGVYFVRVHEFIKIGSAADVRARWAYCTDNPYEIELLAYLPVKGEWKAARAREAELHRQFGAYRHRGEWFRIHDALEQFIQEHAQPWPKGK